VFHQRAVPRPDRHVGDGIILAADEAMLGKLAIEYVKLTLYLHREAIDGIFKFLRRIGVEMPEAAAKIRGRAHLPEQPGEALRPPRRVRRQEGAEFLREIDEDRAGLENTDRRAAASVHQGRNFGVRIDGDEATA